MVPLDHQYVLIWKMEIAPHHLTYFVTDLSLLLKKIHSSFIPTATTLWNQWNVLNRNVIFNGFGYNRLKHTNELSTALLAISVSVWGLNVFSCLHITTALSQMCPGFRGDESEGGKHRFCFCDRKSCIGTYLLTPWCTVLLQKPTGLQLVKKFPALHGTRRFITPLTTVRHLSLSWASPIQSIYPHPTSCRPILILSTHLRLGLPSGLFPSSFPTKTLYTPLSSPICATCPAHLILLDFMDRNSII